MAAIIRCTCIDVLRASAVCELRVGCWHVMRRLLSRLATVAELAAATSFRTLRTLRLQPHWQHQRRMPRVWFADPLSERAMPQRERLSRNEATQ